MNIFKLFPVYFSLNFNEYLNNTHDLSYSNGRCIVSKFSSTGTLEGSSHFIGAKMRVLADAKICRELIPALKNIKGCTADIQGLKESFELDLPNPVTAQANVYLIACNQVPSIKASVNDDLEWVKPTETTPSEKARK